LTVASQTVRHSKKVNSLTTFGPIEIQEQVFRKVLFNVPDVLTPLAWRIKVKLSAEGSSPKTASRSAGPTTP
jgi:hypothetical protein